MSLHRYLRLRRLWLVRQQLRAGTQSVKATALAFGFWHFGDFAQSYRSLFGETPSETLARARGGRGRNRLRIARSAVLSRRCAAFRFQLARTFADAAHTAERAG